MSAPLIDFWVWRLLAAQWPVGEFSDQFFGVGVGGEGDIIPGSDGGGHLGGAGFGAFVGGEFFHFLFVRCFGEVIEERDGVEGEFEAFVIGGEMASGEEGLAQEHKGFGQTIG